MKGYPYHIVTSSPWPLITTISVFSLFVSNVLLFHNKIGANYLLLASILSLGGSLFFWFEDIMIEGTYKGEHTDRVQKGLTLGFILFVISEICVFFGLFFAYFYNSLVPSIEVGGIWPPVGIVTLDFKGVPILNTLILLCSGFTITACHNYLISGYNKYSQSFYYLLITILLGLVFSYFQYFEYFNSMFTIVDSIYGSSFFILTGCHALHIIIGTLMLIFSLLRLSLSHFTSTHHLLFSFSAIYWHMVDAVWLVLYVVIYCWSA